MRHPFRCLGLVAVSVFFAAAQSDEVRVSAHTYVPPQLRLSVQTQLVEMDVIVRDGRGHVVSGLKPGDFEILDEGKPREISAFTAEARTGTTPAAPAAPAPVGAEAAPAPPSPPPAAPLRSTLLFFDDLHATGPEMQRTQAAARRFIQDGLGPGGRAGVFASSQGLVLDFTADSAALTAAIGKLRSHQHLSENGLQPCPHISPYQAYLIENNELDALNSAVQETRQCMNAAPSDAPTTRSPRITSTRDMDPTIVSVKAQATATWQQVVTDSRAAFDALDNALNVIAKAPGTRVLLMVSAGFLSGHMDNDRAEVIDRAVRSGIVVNAIDAKGLWTEAPGRESQTTGSLPLATFFFETTTIGSRNEAADQAMAELTIGTGGLFFHNRNDLVEGFAQLGAVPETTYLIAFRPDSETPAGQYHRLKVRLAGHSGDYVQARPGYITPGPASETKAEVRPIDREAAGSEVLTQIPVRLAGQFGKSEKGEPLLSLTIHVDLAGLNFTQRDDRHMEKLNFIGALLDSAGNMVAAKEGEMDFALKDATLDRLKNTGVNANLSLSAPPGSYRVRVVVADAEGKMAAGTQAVEIPK